ncbi:MAG: hypothetical protein K6A23_00270 [Butyrivibrio sp.]|nr:hypothetical protein [Butyrivibrio sp.]
MNKNVSLSNRRVISAIAIGLSAVMATVPITSLAADEDIPEDNNSKEINNNLEVDEQAHFSQATLAEGAAESAAMSADEAERNLEAVQDMYDAASLAKSYKAAKVAADIAMVAAQEAQENADIAKVDAETAVRAATQARAGYEGMKAESPELSKEGSGLEKIKFNTEKAEKAAQNAKSDNERAQAGADMALKIARAVMDLAQKLNSGEEI